MPALVRYALSWPCARRALMYAVVVGAVLIGINHGDSILRGEVDGARMTKMGLTILVPYLVSMLSSVGAYREHSRGGESR